MGAIYIEYFPAGNGHETKDSRSNRKNVSGEYAYKNLQYPSDAENYLRIIGGLLK
jgi:hypothetical protein